VTKTVPLVSFRGITRVYGEGGGQVRALAGVDLTIERGEFIAIMGPSGSGKSTAMNIIGCLDRPSAGSFSFSGVEVNGLTRDQRALLRRNFIGFVFQGFNLLNRTTAIENVELPLIYRGSWQGTSGGRRRCAHFTWWGSRGARTIRRASFRAASSSAWPSPAPSSPIRFCSGGRAHRQSRHGQEPRDHGADRKAQHRTRHHRRDGDA
jgi:ABC-type sugar transport system ATPase subunit